MCSGMGAARLREGGNALKLALLAHSEGLVSTRLCWTCAWLQHCSHRYMAVTVRYLVQWQAELSSGACFSFLIRVMVLEDWCQTGSIR